jgi:hypothetical protein
MKVGPWQAKVEAGMFADYPAGDYDFEVCGADEAQVVNVWLLPIEVRG